MKKVMLADVAEESSTEEFVPLVSDTFADEPEDIPVPTVEEVARVEKERQMASGPTSIARGDVGRVLWFTVTNTSGIIWPGSRTFPAAFWTMNGERVSDATKSQTLDVDVFANSVVTFGVLVPPIPPNQDVDALRISVLINGERWHRIVDLRCA